MPLPEEILQKQSKNGTEKIRVILDKPLWEKISLGIGTALKIGIISIIFIGIFSASNTNPPAPKEVQKQYLKQYFQDTPLSADTKEIAIIPITGTITDTAADSIDSLQSANFPRINKLLLEAAEDPQIAAVLIRVDSPGGTALAAEKIVHTIEQVQKTKPVYALLEGSATSAGYYIPSVTEKIFAYPGTITGNIGVVVMLPQVDELLEKIGVDMNVITSGEFKDMGSPFRGLTEAEDQMFRDLINESHEAFVRTVADGRDMDIDTVRALADGRIYSGTQAKENGLIDQTVSSLGQVITMIERDMDEDQLQPVILKTPMNPWQSFLLSVRHHGVSINGMNHFLEENVFGSGPRLLAQ